LPALYVSPTGTSAGTSWATAGTGIGVNAPAAFGGNLLDLQVNGSRRAAISSAGTVLYPTTVFSLFEIVGDAIRLDRASSSNIVFRVAGDLLSIGTNGINVAGNKSLGFSSGDANNSSDVTLARDAADTLAQRRTTNAQTFRVYGTYTDASNHVRAALSSTSTAVTLAAETAGTGADNIPLNLTAAGTGTIKVNSVAEVVVSSTVAGLPAAPVVGMLTRVTDATAPVVGMTVAGGGAAAALCWYNGANWSVIGV